MTAVYATDLDGISKSILVYMSYRKNWKEGTFAYPSAERVAKDTGFGIATVRRNMRKLRDQGYLCDTGQRKGAGVKVYDLNDPGAITVIGQTYQSDKGGYQSDRAALSEGYTEQVHNKILEQDTEQVLSQTKDEPVQISSTDSISLGVEESTSLVENSNGTLPNQETVQERLTRIRETQAKFARRTA